MARRFAPVGLFLLPIDGLAGSSYLAASSPLETPVTETQDQRIAREEGYWNAPRLFGLGFAFLGAALVFIYVIASI